MQLALLELLHIKLHFWRQGTSWCNYFVISIKDEIYFYKRFFTRTFVRFLYLINIFIIYAGLTFGRMKFPFFNFNITEFQKFFAHATSTRYNLLYKSTHINTLHSKVFILFSKNCSMNFFCICSCFVSWTILFLVPLLQTYFDIDFQLLLAIFRRVPVSIFMGTLFSCLIPYHTILCIDLKTFCLTRFRMDLFGGAHRQEWQKGPPF